MIEAVWLIPALPALSAVVIFATGRQWHRKGAEVGIVVLAAVAVDALLRRLHRTTATLAVEEPATRSH